MSLRPTEIQAVRNYLGYSSITALALPYLDVALVFEQVVQNNLDSFGESMIRDRLLPQIRQVEDDIFAARTKYVASEVDGEVKIDPMMHSRYTRLREWLIDRLSETVQVPRARLRSRSSGCDVY